MFEAVMKRLGLADSEFAQRLQQIEIDRRLTALNFCRSHITKSFIWTSPIGEAGLYRVEADSVKAQPLSSRVMTITATFKQTYSP